MVNVTWIGGMAFEANPESGNKVVLDAHPEPGARGLGPTPVEALLSSLAACSAMDVLSILRKKQQVVESYRVEIDGDRSPLEAGWPRPFTAIRVRHILAGPGLDPVAVARSIELSEQKYCTVLATLKLGPPVSSSFVIERGELSSI